MYFSIQTVKEGKPHLDYENRQNVNNGYCDMWNTEGYQTVRVDSEGHIFSFQEGMVFVFDQKKNMHTDSHKCRHTLKIFFQYPCHRIVINNKQEVVHI